LHKKHLIYSIWKRENLKKDEEKNKANMIFYLKIFIHILFHINWHGFWSNMLSYMPFSNFHASIYAFSRFYEFKYAYSFKRKSKLHTFKHTSSFKKRNSKFPSIHTCIFSFKRKSKLYAFKYTFIQKRGTRSFHAVIYAYLSGKWTLKVWMSDSKSASMLEDRR